MSKIVVKTEQCAHRRRHFTRLGNLAGHICGHPKGNLISCRYSAFPVSCPLEDGMTMKDHLDSVLDLKRRTDKSAQTLKAVRRLKETLNIPELSPQFYYCSYCKAYVVINSMEDADKHVSMIHGIVTKIPPCKQG
jgi:hypothetical protein